MIYRIRKYKNPINIKIQNIKKATETVALKIYYYEITVKLFF